MSERLATRCRVRGAQGVEEVVEKGDIRHVHAPSDVDHGDGPRAGQETDLAKYENCCGLGILHEPADGESLIVWKVGTKDSSSELPAWERQLRAFVG